MLAATCAVVFAPTADATSALHVRGVAGSSYWVTVAPGTQFSNAGWDATASSTPGGWGAVALVRLSKDERVRPSDVYAATYLPESVRCPGARCPWAVPPPVFTSDMEGNLAAGRYRLVLIGPKGSTVDVALHPTRGRVSSPHRAPSVLTTAVMVAGTGPAGHESVLNGYASLPPGQGWGLIMGLPVYAIAPAGVISYAGCITAGPSDSIVETVGGVAPCADFRGLDVFNGPDAAPATTVVGTPPTGYAGAAAVWGPRLGDSFGAGWDMTATGASSFLRFAVAGFALPN